MSLYYLCADCGGTKTSVVICDSEGKEISRASGGPSNFSYLGLEAFVQVLQTTTQAALHVLYPEEDPSSLSLQGQFASIWIAVSGVDSPSDIRSLNKALSPLFALPSGNRLQITNDAHLLASPLNSHPELDHAVAVIAGTGSVVITFSKGESENGISAPLKEMARVGGWGWILGDLGSGFEIGREAVRELLTRADMSSVQGQPAVSTDPQSLQSRILDHFGINLVHDLLGVVYAPDPLPITNGAVEKHPQETGKRHPTAYIARERRLSHLSPLVFEAAFKHGDEMALNVITRCASAFAQLIASTLRPAVGEAPSKAVEASKSILCLGGSLLNVEQYRNLICEELRRLGHVFPCVEFVNDVALSGARSLAVLDK